MAAPLIGITSNYAVEENSRFGTISLGESYVQAVLQAGGLPVIIPAGVEDQRLVNLLERLDGVLFTGGADVDPRRFGGLPHPRVYGIEPRRDALEIQAVRWVVEQGKPFLGICRGIQVINVAMGGSLFTDIGDQMENALRHDWFPDIPRNYLAHGVTLVPGSALGEILGSDPLQVNSLHHQGIQHLAASLRAVAYAPDHLVEAVEVSGHPFGLGVQWHPEWLQEHAPQRKLFQAFVQAAARGEN